MTASHSAGKVVGHFPFRSAHIDTVRRHPSNVEHHSARAGESRTHNTHNTQLAQQSPPSSPAGSRVCTWMVDFHFCLATGRRRDKLGEGMTDSTGCWARTGSEWRGISEVVAKRLSIAQLCLWTNRIVAVGELREIEIGLCLCVNSTKSGQLLSATVFGAQIL